MERKPEIEKEKTAEELRLEALVLLNVAKYEAQILVQYIEEAHKLIENLSGHDLEASKEYLKNIFLNPESKFKQLHTPAQISNAGGALGEIQGDLTVRKFGYKGRAD